MIFYDCDDPDASGRVTSGGVAEDGGTGSGRQPGLYGNGQDGGMPDGAPAVPVNSFAVISLGCAVTAFLLMNLGTSVMFGALGIIFALLSRSDRLDSRAKAGLILSVAAIVIFVSLIVWFMVTMVSTGTWDRILQQVEEVDMTSGNAYSDIYTIIVRNLSEMYEELTQQLMGGMI